MLRADCSRCAGLCCVALAFDASDKFAFDKKGGEPCRHLTSAFACSIHKTLRHDGFTGCAQYDCLGAGQRVTQELYAGRNWRDEPDIALDMFEAFRLMRKVHDLLQLLESAGRLPLSGAQETERARLIALLSPAPEWTLDGLRAFEQGPLPQQVAAWLASLKELAASLSRATTTAGSAARRAPSSP